MKRITRRRFFQLSGMAAGAALLAASTGMPELEPKTEIDPDTSLVLQTGRPVHGSPWSDGQDFPFLIRRPQLASLIKSDLGAVYNPVV